MQQKEVNIIPGKNRWKSILFMTAFYQFVIYVDIALGLYAILTFNWQIFLGLLTISLLQNLFGRSQKFINWMNKNARPIDYFQSFKRIYEESICEDEKCMFCFAPHAIFNLCIAFNMNADNSKMSRMVGLGSRLFLLIPIAGLVPILWGVTGVNPKNVKKLMGEGKTVGLVPGGFEEATLTTPKEIRVWIKNRKGFIKYALKYNYTIYPVLTYNEHKGFKTFDHFTSFRLFLNRLKIPTVMFWGGFLQCFFPLNVNFVSIVGKGIRRDKNNIDQEVTQEEIDETHKKYMQEFQRIHEKHKELGGSVPLVFY